MVQSTFSAKIGCENNSDQSVYCSDQASYTYIHIPSVFTECGSNQGFWLSKHTSRRCWNLKHDGDLQETHEFWIFFNMIPMYSHISMDFPIEPVGMDQRLVAISFWISIAREHHVFIMFFLPLQCQTHNFGTEKSHFHCWDPMNCFTSHLSG